LTPSVNFTPASRSTTSSWPLKGRWRSCIDSSSLMAIANAAVSESAPFVSRERRRIRHERALRWICGPQVPPVLGGLVQEPRELLPVTVEGSFANAFGYFAPYSWLVVEGSAAAGEQGGGSESRCPSTRMPTADPSPSGCMPITPGPNTPSARVVGDVVCADAPPGQGVDELVLPNTSVARRSRSARSRRFHGDRG
jgi:hypothetical protein